MARVIREVRPHYVFVENSPMLTSRGLGCVLGDLAAMGYDARWGVLGAHHVGAPHKRDRIWIVAANANRQPRKKRNKQTQAGVKAPQGHDASRRRFQAWWAAEPNMGRVADGVAHRVDRLKALGNGQVPAVAALAWGVLSDGM